jgi:tetratricopeptide (TPR) repeat protein
VRKVEPNSRRPLFAVVLCALLAVLIYTPVLRYDLVWDDQDLIVRNQTSPHQAFVHSFWHGGGAGLLGRDPYYRPLANFSLGVDDLIAGHRAWFFHLTNVVLHAAAVALGCIVVWQLFGSFWLVLAAGVVSAVHPLAADGVVYVSGRTDLLAGIGLLVALLGLVRLSRQADRPAVAMTWAGFVFAVLSKEVAVMFVPVAAIFLAAPGLRQMRRQDRVTLVGLLVLLAAYLVARRAVLGSVVGMSVGATAGTWLTLSLSNFGRLLFASVFPWGQPVFLETTVSGRNLGGFAFVGVLFLVLPLVFRPMRESRQVLLAWLWGLAMLLPFAGLAGFGPMGRLLYVPAIGLLLLALYVARENTRGRRWARVPGLVAVFAYCLLLAVLALPRRTSVWRDGYTLFSRMTGEAPTYAAGHFNYAFELRRRGDLNGAIAEYRRAIELDSTMALAYSNLGALLQSGGYLAQAESLYLRTIRLRPDYALAWNNLAIVRYRRGDGSGALQAFRRAIELKPDDAGALYNLGRLYQQAGMDDSSAMLFERAFRLDPANPQVRASYYQTHGGQR